MQTRSFRYVPQCINSPQIAQPSTCKFQRKLHFENWRYESAAWIIDFQWRRIPRAKRAAQAVDRGVRPRRRNFSASDLRLQFDKWRRIPRAKRTAQAVARGVRPRRRIATGATAGTPSPLPCRSSGLLEFQNQVRPDFGKRRNELRPSCATHDGEGAVATIPPRTYAAPAQRTTAGAPSPHKCTNSCNPQMQSQIVNFQRNPQMQSQIANNEWLHYHAYLAHSSIRMPSNHTVPVELNTRSQKCGRHCGWSARGPVVNSPLW